MLPKSRVPFSLAGNGDAMKVLIATGLVLIAAACVAAVWAARSDNLWRDDGASTAQADTDTDTGGDLLPRDRSDRIWKSLTERASSLRQQGGEAVRLLPTQTPAPTQTPNPVARLLQQDTAWRVAPVEETARCLDEMRARGYAFAHGVIGFARSRQIEEQLNGMDTAQLRLVWVQCRDARLAADVVKRQEGW